MSLSLEHFEGVARSFEGVLRKLEEDCPLGESLDKLEELRFYQSWSMRRVLEKVGFYYVPWGYDSSWMREVPYLDDLGLVTKEGRFLLEGRFVFPVRDLLGNVLTLIGWYPDEKKYITAPSYFFLRSALYFGLEQVGEHYVEPVRGDILKYLLDNGIDTTTLEEVWSRYGIICEGIFDALSLRSLGFRAYASMGVSSGGGKQVLYPLLGRELVGVSDRDRAGLEVMDRDSWRCGRYLSWVGSIDVEDLVEEPTSITEEGASDGGSETLGTLKIKDIDDLIKLYPPAELALHIAEVLTSDKSKIVKIRIGE